MTARPSEPNGEPARGAGHPRRPHLAATLRHSETVTPLELFYDLIFVLAVTQCTSLMAADPTWHGVAQGLLVLAMLWWAWVGYAWLTSVVDPEEGAVRFVIFTAMAATLVVTLTIPQAFDDLALTFAVAYSVVRIGQILLFVLGSRDDPNLRASVLGLAGSTSISISLLIVASFLDAVPQGILWLLALLLDAGGPYLFGAEGWKLVPRHFAERHGLIVLIALGESIVAIGVGADASGVDASVVVAVVLGFALIAGFWWAYFDVTAIAAARRLEAAPVGREQNEIARDSYSYLHFPMVAGVVLVALGLKTTLAHLDHLGDALHSVPAVALCGGTTLYFLAHLAFRYRNIGSVSRERAALAVASAAMIPAAVRLPALATLAILTLLVWIAIGAEVRHLREVRHRIRHGDEG